jgi:tetratricopeptide (TPR) repeat protein
VTDNKTKHFQIRNQRHQIVGTFTEIEIIKRIAAGKYNGNEEVSSEPFHIWQRLSSHPAFYDAFLKRLFVEGYSTPKDPSGEPDNSAKKRGGSSKSLVSRPPNSNNNANSEGSKEEHQATQQLLVDRPGNEVEIDGQRELEKLLSEASEEQEHSLPGALLAPKEVVLEQEEKQLGLALLDDSKDENRTAETQSKSIQLESVDEDVESVNDQTKSKNRKLFLVAGAAIFLVLLGWLGLGGPETDTKLISTTEHSSIDFLIEKSNLNALNKEELISALSEEALHFYDFDTPLHYSGALSLFEETHELNPTDPYNISGVILARAHGLDQDPNNAKAIEQITALISKGREIEPQLNAFYRAEALIAYYQKNVELALEKIRFARESDPVEPESAVLEAEFLNAIGDRNQARVQIEKVLPQAASKVRAYYVAAQIALDMGDLDDAEKRAKEALLINPMHANTHYLIAETYQKRGNRGAAIAHFDLVTKLAPLASRTVLADAHFSLAKLLDEQGNSVEATKHNKLAYYFSKGALPGLNKTISGVESDEENLKAIANEEQYGVSFYNARAEEFINEGRMVLGLEYLQVVRLLTPNDPGALIRVADVLEKLAVSYEKLKRVEILYQRAIQKDPTYLDSYVKLASIETEQYNFEKAYKLLTKAATVIGIDGLDPLVGGGCRDKIAFTSKAKDEYKLFLALGKHFFKRENYVCAGSFLQQARSSSPVNSEMFFYFGKLTELYKTEAPPEAARYYYQAYTIDSSNYEALASWAKIKTKLGDKNYVIKYIRALLETEPQNGYLFWVLGETYTENQEYYRAISFYKKALDYNSRFSKTRISLARALSALGQTNQAISEYSYAASTDRRNGIGFFEAAQLQTVNKKYQDAETLVIALIESTPNYPGAHRLLSQIYQLSGKKDEAIAEMLKESQNNPLNTRFTIELAEVYMKYQKFELAARVLARITNLPGESKAPEFRADRTQAFLLLSRCLRALNRPDNAEGAIKLALEIDNNDPELHREMGYVYHDLQRYREGVKEFEVYLQRNPAGADVENIKGLIKKMVIEE